MLAHKLGWQGIRDKSYYDFINEFELLVDKYFDFTVYYYNQMIDKFDKLVGLSIAFCK